MTRDVILVLNAGSSSLKFSVYDATPWMAGADGVVPQEPVWRGRVEGMPAHPRWVGLRGLEVVEEEEEEEEEADERRLGTTHAPSSSFLNASRDTAPGQRFGLWGIALCTEALALLSRS